MNERIKTKRGNSSSNLKTKSMSRLYIGLQKVALDQNAKAEKVRISTKINGVLWEREIKNKSYVSCEGLMAAIRYARPYFHALPNARPVVTTHYVLSTIGKNKLQRMKRNRTR